MEAELAHDVYSQGAMAGEPLSAESHAVYSQQSYNMHQRPH